MRRQGADRARQTAIAIGGSAGAIDALITLIRGLPADLPAVVFVVVHIPPGSPSRLPEILSRVGALPAAHARDGERVAPGHVYVAPPDRHLLVRRGWIELSSGPRENHSRPAIDPLFRSAARAYGPGTIGIVLSGALYDGAAGLLAVTARGGSAIVQDPEEAIIPSMPQRAVAMVESARVLPAGEIAQEIMRLIDACSDPPGEEGTRVTDAEDQIAHVIQRTFVEQATDTRDEELSIYTCPDCGGVMWQAETGTAEWFRCHVGHAYAPEVLLIQKSEELEAALWACVRLLREKATLTRQTAARSGSALTAEAVHRIEERARLDEERARIIRQLLEVAPTSGEQAGEILGEAKAADTTTTG